MKGIPVDDVDAVSKRYLEALLSEDTQKQVAGVLNAYRGKEKDSAKEFKKALDKQIEDKEKQYENLMGNLYAAALPQKIVTDITNRLQMLQDEIDKLKNTEPPKDYTVDMVSQWLLSLQKNPDQRAMRLFISRIEAKKDEKNNEAFNIESTLKASLEKMVAGEGFEPTTSGL